MIIESFRDGDAAPVYRRIRERGRLEPEGLGYVTSWVTSDMTRCFQVMECSNRALLDDWISRWSDLVDFRVVPVVDSSEAAASFTNTGRGLAESLPPSADSVAGSAVRSWSEFAALEPELAEAGRRLLYQFGVGLGYLATVRPDGGPRLHPFCPIVHGPGLYGLIGASPKQRDLLRDGRCAIHSFPGADRDDEFYLTARALHLTDEALAGRVREAMVATGASSSGDELLFEFQIERAMLALYKKRGEPENWPPSYTTWKAPANAAMSKA
jgi:hypothetical protein